MGRRGGDIKRDSEKVLNEGGERARKPKQERNVVK